MPYDHSGMSGTIKFLAGPNAPDSDSIRLLQIARIFDSGTGQDYVWKDEPNRNKMMTTASEATDVREGFYVDHDAAKAKPRAATSDPAVSPYYRDHAPNAAYSQDGSKKGTSIEEASLWDFPGGEDKAKFQFETAAKDVKGGHIYGTLQWGFDLTDPATGKVENEFVKPLNAQSATFNAAVKAFDEFYRNPGSSTAPTK